MLDAIKHLPRALSKLHRNIIPVRAKGCWIFDKDGKKFLDLTSGIGALGTGHSHSHVISRVRDQLDMLVHAGQLIYGSHCPQIELNQKLHDIMPHERLDTFFYTNSGSEATEAAIRIAQFYTGRRNIIAMQGGFHGRTAGALSVTSSNTICRKRTQLQVPGVYFCQEHTASSLNALMEYQTDPKDVAAIIVEPMQGEAGSVDLDARFLRHIEDVCRKNSIMLIADEVQSGAGRTGTWWNVEQKGIRPDMLTFGKAIGSGFPIAGVAMSARHTEDAPVAYLGGTYGGNALCSAAACATIDVINQEHLLANVRKMGEYLKCGILDIDGSINVRQYGLSIVIDFKKTHHHDIPFIISALRNEGILVLTAGSRGQYIRLLPPYIITEAEADIFTNSLRYCLQ